jgi:hypothetical protein
MADHLRHHIGPAVHPHRNWADHVKRSFENLLVDKLGTNFGRPDVNLA